MGLYHVAAAHTACQTLHALPHHVPGRRRPSRRANTHYAPCPQLYLIGHSLPKYAPCNNICP
eukprot:4077965-Lingulodinium_polyedra.AAC.1